MFVRLLGAVTADEGGEELALGGPLQRAMFAMLALARGRVVSTDALVDGLWGERPPNKPLGSLQVYVHGLRRALAETAGGRDTLRSRPPGYCLELSDRDTDLGRFERDWDQARALTRSGQLLQARSALTGAVAWWRGPALADLRGHPFAQAPVARLDEAYLLAVEDLVDVRLACGEHAAVVSELEGLVADNPTRERLWGQLMIALYRADRQVDALATYGRARDRLADELGIDPGDALRALEVSILRHDPQLAAPALPSPPAAVGADGDGRAGPPSRESSAAGLARPRDHARVPRTLTRTVGRSEILGELAARVEGRQTSLISLVGPGGTGKTRLAAELAARVTGFDGGTFFLAATDGQEGAQLLTTLALAVGGSEPADISVEAAVAAVVEGLPAGEVLVVLDNLESIDRAGAAVEALISAAPTVVVITTSRVPLRLMAEYVVMVPPLPVPSIEPREWDVAAALAFPAVELFAERARAGGPGFTVTEANVADVVELCRLLDGVPLALELAAARMRHLTPAAAIARLRHSLDLLSTTAVDLPPRQRTLAGTISWSIEHLPESARTVLDDLVIFEDGFDLEALEAVTGGRVRAGLTAVLDPIEQLGALVDAGLVRLKDTRVELRYQVLATVRSYLALTHPTTPELRESLRARHISWLTGRLGEWAGAIDGPDGDVVLARFADEHPDTIALLDWALDSGRAEAAASLALAAAPSWLAAGRLRLGRDYLVRLQRAPLPTATFDALRLAEARIAYQLGDVAATERLCRAVLAGSPEMPDLAVARCYLGAALVAQGLLDEGSAAAHGALELAATGGDASIQAVALSVLAIAAAMAGDFATERSRYEERLVVVRARGDRARIADTLNTLAEIALDEGDERAARHHVDEALRLAGPHRMLERRDALISAARASALAGDLVRMRTELSEAADIAARTEQPLALAQIARTLGGALADREAFGEAVRLVAMAHELAPPPSGDRAPMESDLAQGFAAALAGLTEAEQERHWMHGQHAAHPVAVAVREVRSGLDRLRETTQPSALGAAPTGGRPTRD